MESNQVVYIRTDGNEKIATGHIMRCLTIAKEVTALHGMVTFVVSDKESETLLKERFDETEAYPVICLNSKWNRLEEELPRLLSLLNKNKVDCMLLDSYFATAHYMEALKNNVRLIYLDDLEHFEYPADVIINYDVGVENNYRYVKTVLTGEQYAPLRKEFWNAGYEVRKEAAAAFISTGGMDGLHIAPRLAERLLFEPETKNMQLHIIGRKESPSYETLLRLAETHNNIQLHHNVQNMAELMKTCDIAVSAAGTTLFELCCVGVPAVSFSMAKNQINCAKGFDAAGYIAYAGDVRDNFDEVMTAVMENVRRLLNSYEERSGISSKMKEGISGYGARSIAEAILNR